MTRFKLRSTVLLTVTFMTALATPVLAVEGGTSFYLLGSKTTMAGYLPPPGFYGILSNYAYSGSADIDFESAGVNLSGGTGQANLAIPL